MKIRDLFEVWEKSKGEQRTHHKYTIKLPLSVAARVRALTEMYPGRSETEIMVDLLDTSLDELLETIPYVQRKSVKGEDEFGEPIYEDVGATPRFIELTNKYLQILEKELSEE